MSVGVLIPWRETGCPHRTAALSHVTAFYAREHPDWQVTVGVHDDGPWCKALAVDRARQRTDADLFVVADADVWTDGLPDAVQAVRDGAAWAVPHRGLHRLTEDSTTRFVAGEPLDRLALDERAYKGLAGGGIVVLSAGTLDAVPLDRRFAGWGSEDIAWAMALHTLHGPCWRGKAPMVHLWHPSQKRLTRRHGNTESRALLRRYQRARGDVDAMRALVAEGRASQCL